ncbi:sugar-binding transcriptional regulator [Limosilactobacillus fermentum]
MVMRSEKLTETQLKLALRIASSYYLDKVSQTDIAKNLEISRPTVSRYLQYAVDTGMVDIRIQDPFENVGSLEQDLRTKYGLKRAIVVDQVGESYPQILEQLGQATANYLQEIVQDGDTIGLSWGRTMAAVADYLQPSNKKDVQTVYLKGTVANSSRNNYASYIAEKFNQAFSTQTLILPVPVIFDNQETRDAVLRDRFIHQIMETAATAEIALFTVGTTMDDAMLFQLGYLTAEQIAYLKQHAVGDAISQFIDRKGQVADPQLSKQTMALPIEQLKLKCHSILVAGGSTKLAALHAALVGGYASELITDLEDAKQLIEM